jgi:quinol monooxygenase YgiN
MYTATMFYHIKAEYFEEVCDIWNKEIMEHAKVQPGFVRMQFLVSKPDALAIGTWNSQADAQAFMGTGVFKDLMKTIEPMLVKRPEPKIWDLKFYAEH